MKNLVAFAFLFLISTGVFSQTVLFESEKRKNDFPVFYNNQISNIQLDCNDYEVITIAADLLAGDIEAVTGKKPNILSGEKKPLNNVIIIGSIDRNKLIQKLIENGELNIDSIKGKWEASLIATVNNPFPEVEKALVITGSDRRGVAYGAMELSRKMGVSPWIWWADVVPHKQDRIIVKEGRYYLPPPSVKYRGAFLNDELWGLRQWAAKTQDTIYKDMGPNAYAKVFELMLRLKANYIWPARHTAFNEKPENAVVADRYAIVRGGAHNSPMLGNARKEWDEEKMGEWNYLTNKKNIIEFWKNNLKKFGQYENVYTIGMRGVGDLPMKGGQNMAQKVEALQQIIQDQRELLSEYYGKPASEIPQIFAAYKEVLNLYKHGMDLPEDITIVWPDDNYGYMKQLSGPQEQKRPDGSGVYYHFSYLGWPHEYLWLCTTPPTLIWEELKKSYDYDARNLWVMNVGDIKPAEYEWQLSMDMAWHTNDFSREKIKEHMTNWYSVIFGKTVGEKAVEIKNRYYHLAFPRKPEYMSWKRLSPDPESKEPEFSFIHYREAEKRIVAYNRLQKDVQQLYKTVAEKDKPAFFQLVYYPVMGAALMNKKFLLAQKNRWYARQGRAVTNKLAEHAVACHDSILELTREYESLNDSKWHDMMSYDDMPWDAYDAPPVNTVELSRNPDWGVWAEGNEGDEILQQLPMFNSVYKKKHFFEVFNKSKTPFSWTAAANQPWVKLSASEGTVKDEQRIFAEIDWNSLPEKKEVEAEITITTEGKSRKLKVLVFNPEISGGIENLYVEDNGVISVPAEDFHRKTDKPGYAWKVLDNIGLTGKLMTTLPMTTLPVDHDWNVADNAPFLEYDFYTFHRGWFDIHSYTLPTHPITEFRGTKYAVSIDDEPPLLIDSVARDGIEDWYQNVSRNADVETTEHFISEPGKHKLKVWLLDPGVCIDRMVIDFGGLKESYLGPEKTYIK